MLKNSVVIVEKLTQNMCALFWKAMTNGRFVSVRHRAVVNSVRSRTSTVYFAAPALHATISCLEGSGALPLQKPPVYRSFTWGEYKKATYTRRLEDCRLNLFKVPPPPHID